MIKQPKNVKKRALKNIVLQSIIAHLHTKIQFKYIMVLLNTLVSLGNTLNVGIHVM